MENTFDQLSRLAGRRSRRRSVASGVLGGIVSGLFALLASRTTEQATAKPARRPPARCRKPKRRCGKRCVNLKTNRQHCGTCNNRCQPGQRCRQGVCRPAPCGRGGPCRVFVSSQRYQGDMGGVGGVRGADRACNDLAQTAGLPGTYKAWLSDTNHAPVTTFVRNPGP